MSITEHDHDTVMELCEALLSKYRRGDMRDFPLALEGAAREILTLRDRVAYLEGKVEEELDVLQGDA